MLMVTAGSVDISVSFDVLSVSEFQERSFGGSEMEDNEKPVRSNSPRVSGGCVKGSLQSYSSYSCAKRNAEF